MVAAASQRDRGEAKRTEDMERTVMAMGTKPKEWLKVGDRQKIGAFKRRGAG